MGRAWSGPGSRPPGRRHPGGADPAVADGAGRRNDAALWVATFAGAISVVLALIGFPALGVRGATTGADQEGDAANRTALAAAWLAQHQFGGALLGEHLVNCWESPGPSPSASSFSALGTASLAGSRRPGRECALFPQPGRHPGNGPPGFPVFDLAGLIGSSGWDSGWLPLA